MSYGISFIDILVSEATMILACIVFVISIVSLIFCRKRLSSMMKTILLVITFVTIVYLMFIMWLIIGFGSH